MLKEDAIEIKIKNDSNEPIEQLEFTTTEEIEMIRIERMKPKEVVSEFLSMRKNQRDGAYLLSFIRANGQKEMIQGGYYSNGTPFYQEVHVIVKSDTVLMEFNTNIR